MWLILQNITLATNTHFSFVLFSITKLDLLLCHRPNLHLINIQPADVLLNVPTHWGEKKMIPGNKPAVSQCVTFGRFQSLQMQTKVVYHKYSTINWLLIAANESWWHVICIQYHIKRDKWQNLKNLFELFCLSDDYWLVFRTKMFPESRARGLLSHRKSWATWTPTCCCHGNTDKPKDAMTSEKSSKVLLHRSEIQRSSFTLERITYEMFLHLKSTGHFSQLVKRGMYDLWHHCTFTFTRNPCIIILTLN